MSDSKSDGPCRAPGCDRDATDTYLDRAGNELALCGDHYARAVAPEIADRTIWHRSTDDEPRGLKRFFTHD